MRQIIIGRVFEDRNGNGKFDSGERPVAGARIYMNNGQSVITDSAGQYNLPAVSQGAIVLSLDPVTLPKKLQSARRRRQKIGPELDAAFNHTPRRRRAFASKFRHRAERRGFLIAEDIKVITANGVFVFEKLRRRGQTESNRENGAKIAFRSPA